MLSGSFFGLSVMVVIIIAGTSWVWMAGRQMSTDYNLAAQVVRMAPKGPFVELPAPPRSQPDQPTMLTYRGAKQVDTTSTSFAPDMASPLSSLTAAKRNDYSATDPATPVGFKTPASAVLDAPPTSGYVVSPASPALDEDDPVASSELNEWLNARNLSFLATSLEQLGAYHTSDLAMLDDKDKR
jgi:uncharacterized iron-regulated membrane protein